MNTVGPVVGAAPDVECHLEAALAHWAPRPEHLVQILRVLQERLGWLPPEALAGIARRLGLTIAFVRGVADFYAHLYTAPVGAYRVLFSDNITDRMQGSQALMDGFCKDLWVEPGKVSEDGLVSVARTSCTGLCDQGPALLVNGRAVPHADRQRLAVVRDLIVARRPLAQWPGELFEVQDNVRRSDVLLETAVAPGDALRVALEHSPEALLAQVERSGLRGRGGAGFPVAAKWAACRAAPGPTRYLVCNADEGEPGTFKDRVLLSRRVELLFDGMTIAAWCIGARRGFVYLRGEYRFLLEALEAALARRRQAGLLGRDILGRTGFDFDVTIHVGAGAYVCGEASAMLESLEGKRGIPRNRPPRMTERGLFQSPTVVNNVETLCAAGLVTLLGADRYRGRGTARSSGTMLLSVAGDCARPGVYEYPLGVSVRKVLADCGAVETLAVQVSGPSGHCLDASEFDRRLAFEDLVTAGAFTVFDTRRDMFEVARNYVEFFAHESCGFCTPCRVGTSMLLGIMNKIHRGRGSLHELEQMARLQPVLTKSAHCGLGHTACNPVMDTLKHFRPAYERRLQALRFAPDFDLDAALAAARRATGRDDAGAHLESRK